MELATRATTPSMRTHSSAFAHPLLLMASAMVAAAAHGVAYAMSMMTWQAE